MTSLKKNEKGKNSRPLPLFEYNTPMLAKLTKKHPKGFGFLVITSGELKGRRAFFHKTSLLSTDFDNDLVLGIELSVENVFEGEDKN